MFEQYKMIMVVRADLKMGKGKVAAQVSKFVLYVCKYISYINLHSNLPAWIYFSFKP